MKIRIKERWVLIILAFGLLGSSPSFGEVLFSFEGQIDFSRHQFDFVLDFPTDKKSAPILQKEGANLPEDRDEIKPSLKNTVSGISDKKSMQLLAKEAQRSIAVRGEKTSENDYYLSLNIEHLKTPFFDLLSEIESTVEVIGREEGRDNSIQGKKNQRKRNFDNIASPILDATSLRGKIWSQYSLIDYRPLRELSGQFEINNKRLLLTSLSIGNIACSGYIDLVHPHKVDLIFVLSSVDMDDFLNFWVRDKKYDSAGAVFGEIRVTGELDQIFMKGNLESHNGFIKKLRYDSIYLNVEGFYPNIQITNSSISETDSLSFTLDGKINLSDQKNFKKQLKALTISPLVSDSISEAEWTIKRFKEHDSGTTEIMYRLRKGEGAGSSVFDESDMLGIERTMEF
jgi:hypothetical protein